MEEIKKGSLPWLIEEAKRKEVSLSSIAFEKWYALDRSAFIALFQEMAAVLTDEQDEALMENLKLFHEELFEEV